MDSAPETLIRVLCKEMDFDLKEVQEEDCPRWKRQRLGGIRSMVGSEKGVWGTGCYGLSSYGQRCGICLWDLTFLASSDSLSRKLE